MSSVQSACIAHRNGKTELNGDDVVDVVIDGKIDANGNKIKFLSSDEDTISSTSSTDSMKEESDDTDDELILKTR